MFLAYAYDSCDVLPLLYGMLVGFAGLVFLNQYVTTGEFVNNYLIKNGIDLVAAWQGTLKDQLHTNRVHCNQLRPIIVVIVIRTLSSGGLGGVVAGNLLRRLSLRLPIRCSCRPVPIHDLIRNFSREAKQLEHGLNIKAETTAALPNNQLEILVYLFDIPGYTELDFEGLGS